MTITQGAGFLLGWAVMDLIMAGYWMNRQRKEFKFRLIRAVICLVVSCILFYFGRG